MRVSGTGCEISVGLFIPTEGSAGVWGPSCRAAAELAVAECNALGGLAGRSVNLVCVNAGDEPEAVAARADELVHTGAIEAIVGMHTSDVRVAIAARVAGDLPYVYTPLYEGGSTPGVICIGETPAMQLLPGLDHLCDRYRLQRWFLVGNDYVWPRASHGAVHRHLAGGQRSIVGQAYLPLGSDDFASVLERIALARADAVLVSLVGQDAVHFNRQFALAGLDNLMIRFSCATEETTLLSIGADNTHGLFSASGYFATLPTPSNRAFQERYHTRFAERAPPLNMIGQSVYEGFCWLSALMNGEHDWRCPGPLTVEGARRMHLGADGIARMPVYLAEAQGHTFSIVAQLPS